ncbi:MAG: hypothetical protein H6R15_1766 [Proteobacteria bacterium]|nr:hypothetical protein [Pseudomonadota bacterium]
MVFFLIGALRAIVEMLGLCLIGQAVLYLLSGQRRHANPVYQLLDLLTRAPRQLCARLLPANSSQILIAIGSFVILAFLWLGLAWLRKFH